MSMSAADPHLAPFYWSQLSQDDKDDFFKVRSHFRQGQKGSSKDRRIVTFRRELLVVLGFIERRRESMEARAVLAGVCFVGRLICVNTRQLNRSSGAASRRSTAASSSSDSSPSA
jgi:hypothetical protein